MTLFIIFIVVFDLSSSFLAVMADPVSLTMSPVHSEVFDWYHSSLCRRCGEFQLCLNRDFWRWSMVFFWGGCGVVKVLLWHYFFLSEIKQKGTTICDSTLKEKRKDEDFETLLVCLKEITPLNLMVLLSANTF
jgi:hypothetical protein